MTITAAEPVQLAKTVVPGIGEDMAESAADRARRLWNGDVLSTAQMLLAELSAEEFREVLLPWVADRVRSTMRTEVRAAEMAAFQRPAGRRPTSVRDQRGALPSLDNLEYLLSLPVLVPGAARKHTVLWRDMTAADHECRIAMLERHIDGTRKAVLRHEWSLREIAKYGVTCLGDIDIKLLEADMPK